MALYDPENSQFKQDERDIEKEDARTPEEVLAGQLSDEEIAPKTSTWENEAPRIPEEDMKKCAKILQEMIDWNKSRLASNPVRTWLDIQNRIQERFAKHVKLKAHVELKLHGVNMITNRQVVLALAADEKERIAYRIVDGDIVVPAWFNAQVMVPEIVIDDWEGMDLKQSKAQDQIEQSEKRRLAGDSYHPTLEDSTKT